MAKARAILLRRWPILLIATLMGVPAGIFSSSFGQTAAKPVWMAQQVIVSNRGASGTPAFVQQDALRVTRGEVPQVAAKTLGEPDNVSGLVQKVSAQFDADSSSIKISSADLDSKVATKRVDAFAKAFLAVVNAELQADEQRQLDELAKRVDDAAAALAAFDKVNGDLSRNDVTLPNTPGVNEAIAERRRLNDALIAARQRSDDANLRLSQTSPYGTLGPELPTVQQSYIPKVPKSPLFRAGLLGLLGLMLGVVIVMIIERLNQRIDTRAELADLLEIPIIAEIGHLSRKRMTFHQDGTIRLDGVWAEHYRRIRSAIQFTQVKGLHGLTGEGAVRTASLNGHANGNGNGTRNSSPEPAQSPRVFLFTSTLPGEGKSTCVALTALALAEVGIDTLVINADFRKPKVDQMLGATPSPTMEDRARFDLQRPSIDDVIQSTKERHLYIAASGPPTFEVGNRLAVAREVALEAASRGATVIIDSTPLRVANDPIDMFPVVDAVILVVRAGRSTTKSLADTLELLELHGAPVLGIVLVGTQGTRELYAYYDSYYSRVSVEGDATAATNGSHPVPHEPVTPAQTQYSNAY